MLAPLLAVVVAATSPDAVVARVGSDVITGGEVVARAHALHVRPSVALDDLVQEALVAILARSAGLAADPAVRERLDAERRRLAVDRLLQDEIVSQVKVSDADVARAFHARQDQVRISMVVRATEREARETVERLRGGSGIIEEARSSIDPVGRAKSGVMGWHHRDEMVPALAQVAFAAPIGHPEGPVAVKKGWAVLVIHERHVGDDAALQRGGAEIRRELELERRDQRTRQLMQTLRAKARASVDAAFLRSKGDGLEVGGDAARVVGTDGARAITYGEVVTHLRNDPATTAPRADVSPDAKEQMAWRLVDGRLLEREAARRNLQSHRSTTAALRGVTRAVLARAYAQRVSAQLPAPPRAEIEARYADRTDDFWIASHRMCVLVDARDEAHAKHLRARLAAGEPFEQVGREYVDRTDPFPLEPVRFTDARLDAMSTDQSDQHMLAWTIRKSKPGEWNVVESRAHWHVVRCDAPQPTRRRQLAEVREEIANAIRQERAAKSIDDHIAELRRVTRIRTYTTALSDDTP